MLKTLSPKAALIAVYVEKYGLPLVYLYFAWIEFNAILSLAGSNFQTLRIIWIEPPITQGIVLEEGVQYVIAFMLNFFTATLLLAARRPSVLPRQLKDVAVPLIASFFILAYDSSRLFPASVQKSLFPQNWQAPLIFAGLLLCVFGPAIALWAILSLRRSFGVLVVVRKVVLRGPYKWVRHPMYLGYIFMLIGLFLANCSAVYLFLVPIHILLLVYRARLEERRLCESSTEYLEYKNRVGFLFPILQRRTQTTSLKR